MQTRPRMRSVARSRRAMSESRHALCVQDLRVVVADSGLDIVDGISFELASGEVHRSRRRVRLREDLRSRWHSLGHARPGTRIAGGTMLARRRRPPQASGDEACRRMRGSRISYVPQDPSLSLNPRMRIGRQIDEALPRASAVTRRASVRGLASCIDAVEAPELGRVPQALPSPAEREASSSGYPSDDRPRVLP